jgi:glycosyltransferase involved in cell wall biosynthesis
MPIETNEESLGARWPASEHAAPSPRLLIVSAGVYPPDFGGGQLRVHKTLLRLRERYPLTARVLALTGASSQPEWSTTDGIPIRRLPARMGSLGMALAIGRHLRQERRLGVDAVYTMAIGRVVYLTAFWARLLGMPLIVEIMNRNLLEKRSRRLMAQLLTRSARLVIAISEPVAREIRSLGVPEDRLWVRPNPVDLGRHDLASAEERRHERRELGCADDVCLHVVAGSISPRKNQLLAVDAFERLPEDHRLVIVGPILPQNGSYAQKLEERVARSPARARIKLQLSFRDDLHRLLRAADCLWLPSHEEGLGNVMLEALCCGVPCIINRDLGMDEHVTNGANGWQSVAEAGAWAGAVEKVLPLIRDRDRRRTISAAARARYDAARFDQAFYERVLHMACSGQHRSRQVIEAG